MKQFNISEKDISENDADMKLRRVRGKNTIMFRDSSVITYYEFCRTKVNMV